MDRGQTAAECDWLVDRAAGMSVSWPACGGQVSLRRAGQPSAGRSDHLAWLDDEEFSKLMRRLENSGRPLGDAEFVKKIGRLLSRDLLPKKRGPKGAWKKPKKPRTQ